MERLFYKFKKSQANCYACYYNPYVLVAVDKIGNYAVKKFRNIEYCYYFFEKDVIKPSIKTKRLRFSYFIKDIKAKDYKYFGYGYAASVWCWSIDAYKCFTKNALDKNLKDFKKEISIKKRTIKYYGFLFRKSIKPDK